VHAAHVVAMPGAESVRPCGREPDGHQVRARVWTEFNYEIVGPFDQNGSQPGCDGAQYADDFDLVRVRTCEEVVGCSNWVPPNGWH
jgi:hypothetical protein